MHFDQTRTFNRGQCIVFLKTKEAFGGLSNMAGGFPLEVNGTRILTSEALYQACRFPHLPDIQFLIIQAPSPITAKMTSRAYRHNSRPDWNQVRIKIMRWCLRVKLAQHKQMFGNLLLATGDKLIVEESSSDSFWGAKSVGDHALVGANILGRLLMETRHSLRNETENQLVNVTSLPIPEFKLGGSPIRAIASSDVPSICTSAEPAAVGLDSDPMDNYIQKSIFD